MFTTFANRVLSFSYVLYLTNKLCKDPTKDTWDKLLFLAKLIIFNFLKNAKKVENEKKVKLTTIKNESQLLLLQT